MQTENITGTETHGCSKKKINIKNRKDEVVEKRLTNTQQNKQSNEVMKKEKQKVT